MKIQISSRRKIILLALLVGLICVVLFALCIRRKADKEYAGSILLHNGFSITFITQHSHPFLAEYDQWLNVGSVNEDGTYVSKTVQIHDNTGGRTCVLLYMVLPPRQNCVLIRDRFGDFIVDLKTLHEDRVTAPIDDKMIFLGSFSEWNYPLKFIPCEILQEKKVLDVLKNEAAKEMMERIIPNG